LPIGKDADGMGFQKLYALSLPKMSNIGPKITKMVLVFNEKL